MSHRRTGMELLLVILHFLVFTDASSPIPVVIWHGMGDSGTGSLQSICELIKKEVPGVYVKSIQIGKSASEDVYNSFFKDANIQIEEVCQELMLDERLRDSINLIGFSQGGQFVRALVQRCSGLRVNNLISIAGQHQGVFGFPKCTTKFLHICDYLRELISKGAYAEYLQRNIVQAQYWHDPLQEETYKRKSGFLANINQEQAFNSTYRENMIRLKNFVLAKANNDTVVIPRETEWFGYYLPGQTKNFYKLEESKLFTEDLLGLRTLSETGRLKLLSFDGDHLHFKRSWFVESVIRVFLK